MSKSYNDSLSTKIRLQNSTTAEEILADAAPDLLKACKALRSAYRLSRKQIAGTDAVEEQAIAAIAKAEGEVR